MASLALVLLLAAPPAPAPDEAPDAGACSIGAIESPQAERGVRRFSATRIIDVEVEVTLRGRGSADGLALKVLTPNGHLYQMLAAEPEPLTRRGRDDRKADDKRPRALARLQVAGTTIVTSSLYGRWNVVPYLDGQPCGRPRELWIDP